MESGAKLQLIDQAIQKLLAEKRKKQASSDGLLQDDNDQILLSKLLSELESLKGQDTVEKWESSAEQEEVNSPAFEIETKNEKASQVDSGCTETGTEGIMKEIRKVKRQNIVTHCLLSVMIVLTVAWQLSEVSLILKIKDGLSHPFKSFGSVLTGIIKPPLRDAQDEEKQQSEAPSVPVPFPPVNTNLSLDGE